MPSFFLFLWLKAMGCGRSPRYESGEMGIRTALKKKPKSVKDKVCEPAPRATTCKPVEKFVDEVAVVL